MSGRFRRGRSPSRWRDDCRAGPSVKRERGRSRIRRRQTIHVTEKSRLSKLKAFSKDTRMTEREEVMHEMAAQVVQLAELNLRDQRPPSPEQTRRRSVA